MNTHKNLVGRPGVGGGDVVVQDLAHVADQEAHRQGAAHRALGQLGHLRVWAFRLFHRETTKMLL